MTRLKMTGFEGGHADVFDANSGLTASAAQQRTGAYSALVGVIAYAQWVLTGLPVEIYGRVGLRLTSLLAVTVVTVYGSTGTENISIKVNVGTGAIELWRGGVLLATGAVLVINAWYCIEYHFKIDNVNGIGQVKVNGSQTINFAGDTQVSAAAEIALVRFGSFQGYCDDLVVNDIAGGRNNSWPTQGGIYIVKPEGVGTYSEMTPSAGANWQCVDEIPPTDDTDYVESAVVDTRDSYAMTALVPIVGNIDAVKWVCRSRLVVAGTGAIKYLMCEAGVDFTGADQALDVTYRNVSQILEQAPSGVDWTIAIVNALEAGQKVV